MAEDPKQEFNAQREIEAAQLARSIHETVAMSTVAKSLNIAVTQVEQLVNEYGKAKDRGWLAKGSENSPIAKLFDAAKQRMADMRAGRIAVDLPSGRRLPDLSAPADTPKGVNQSIKTIAKGIWGAFGGKRFPTMTQVFQRGIAPALGKIVGGPLGTAVAVASTIGKMTVDNVRSSAAKSQDVWQKGLKSGATYKETKSLGMLEKFTGGSEEGAASILGKITHYKVGPMMGQGFGALQEALKYGAALRQDMSNEEMYMELVRAFNALKDRFGEDLGAQYQAMMARDLDLSGAQMELWSKGTEQVQKMLEDVKGNLVDEKKLRKAREAELQKDYAEELLAERAASLTSGIVRTWDEFVANVLTGGGIPGQQKLDKTPKVPADMTAVPTNDRGGYKLVPKNRETRKAIIPKGPRYYPTEVDWPVDEPLPLGGKWKEENNESDNPLPALGNSPEDQQIRALYDALSSIQPMNIYNINVDSGHIDANELVDALKETVANHDSNAIINSMFDSAYTLTQGLV